MSEKLKDILKVEKKSEVFSEDRKEQANSINRLCIAYNQGQDSVLEKKVEIDKEKLISVIVAEQFDLSQPQASMIINHFMVKAKRLANTICKADIIREVE